MKTKGAALIIVAISVVSLCLAESARDLTKPPDTLQEVWTELKKTQTQLQQVVTRMSGLERQLQVLEQANARLQQEVKDFARPRLVPLQNK